MKITRKQLKEMILQELNGSALDYGGEELMRSDFRSSKFDEDIKRIMALMDDMESLIRKDEAFEPQDLEYFKNIHLVALMDKISFLEGVIDAKKSGKLDANKL